MSKFVGFLVLVVTLALLLVWQQFRTTRAGYEVARLQKRREKLMEQNTRLECEIANLRSPARLLVMMKELQIDLVHPMEWWQMRRFDAPRNRPVPKPRVQLASAQPLDASR